MIAISTIFALFVFSTCHGRMLFFEQCANDTIDFATKVENSSFVVFGMSKQKTLADGSDSMFHVNFQVDCIFKGPAMPKMINITQAGYVKGKRFCQDFPVARGYAIAFLERNPFDINATNVFIPADFVEVPYIGGNVTHELLADTCGLHQVLPLNSSAMISDACPTVSSSPSCIPTVSTISITDSHSIVIPGGSQVDIGIIRSKSGTIPVEVDTKNGVDAMHINILLFITMILLRLN